VVKKKLSDYLAGIGRQGGKVSAAKLTKVDRIARAKRARAAPIFRQPGTDCLTLQYYNRGKRIRESTGLTDLKAAHQQLTQRLSQIDTGEYIERPMKPVTSRNCTRSSNANTAARNAAVSVP